MNSYAFVVACCPLLLLTVGCGQKAAAPVASSSNFSVNSTTGLATGKVFGIDFEVMGADRAQIKSAMSGLSTSPSRVEVTLADDLALMLQTIDGGKTAGLVLNGRDFGILEAGDKVEIGKDRSVTVNGTVRTPAAVPAP